MEQVCTAWTDTSLLPLSLGGGSPSKDSATKTISVPKFDFFGFLQTKISNSFFLLPFRALQLYIIRELGLNQTHTTCTDLIH
jgi:hypothetical protein